jgi:hypothetical protein
MADKKRKKKEHDFSVTAFRVVQEATGQIEPEPQEPAKKNCELKGTNGSTGAGAGNHINGDTFLF